VSVVAIPPASGAPPAPPPATLGVPVDGGETAPPPNGTSGPSEPIVRAPGVVGLRYTLEGVEVRGNRTTLARVVLRYVPFHAGDPLDPNDRELELTRFRLLGTGFFRDVELSLRKGSRRGYVVLVVDVAERNTIVVDNVWLGLSADANPDGAARPLTAYGGAAVSETNLAGTGITLGGAFAVAEDQLALRARIVVPQFLDSDWSVEAELLYNNAEDYFGNRDVLVDYGTSEVAQDYAILKYHRFGGSVGAGHDLGISTQLFLDYRLEQLNATVPPAASDHRGLDIEPIDFYIDPGTTVLSTIRATLIHDTRDEPVLPTRGDRLVLIGDASISPLGSDYPYAKVQARASHWLKLPWGEHVLRLEAFAGAIFGTAPVFEKFYIGDFSDFLPDRVLDLNVDRRPAPNFFDTDIVEIRYGDYAAELQAEYRIPLYRGHRSIYGIDWFTSAGVYSVANGIDLTQHARGYSGFAAIPIDLTFNFGLRIDTSVGGVVFGLSNFLGFVPVRGTTEGAVR
jgi:outer membrane protein assembly factor BamA